jgi:leader peptidase (prepilin peptidase) / N-methyltransferase
MMLWLATGLLIALAGAVIVMDLRTWRIPDPLNLAIGVSGIAATWMLGRDLLASGIGIVAGYAAIAGLNALYRARRGKDGIGMGDAKFLAAAGAWVGWMGLPFIALIGASLGLAAVGALRIAGRQVEAQDRLPFGPFLAVATVAVWIALTIT